MKATLTVRTALALRRQRILSVVVAASILLAPSAPLAAPGGPQVIDARPQLMLTFRIVLDVPPLPGSLLAFDAVGTPPPDPAARPWLTPDLQAAFGGGFAVVADPLAPGLVYPLQAFQPPAPAAPLLFNPLDLNTIQVVPGGGPLIQSTGFGGGDTGAKVDWDQVRQLMNTGASPLDIALQTTARTFGTAAKWDTFLNPDGSVVAKGAAGEVMVTVKGDVFVLDFSNPRDASVPSMKSDVAKLIQNTPPTLVQLARAAAVTHLGGERGWVVYQNPDGTVLVVSADGNYALLAKPDGRPKAWKYDTAKKKWDSGLVTSEVLLIYSDSTQPEFGPPKPQPGATRVSMASPPAGPPVPPVDVVKLAKQRALEQLFGGMTQSLEGKWEDPNGNAVGLTIAEALVFKQWYVMRQLTTARMEGTALQSLTPEQKAALVAQWKAQSAGLLDKYKVFQQWQAKVGDYPGTTSGIRDTYNRFSAQVSQLESQAALLTAQGKNADAQAALAEAARLKANLAAGDYGQFVKARDAYYAALAANPMLGVKLSSSGPPLFETLVGTSNPAALQAAFDQSVNQFVVQLTEQINRVSQLANTKDLWQLGSSMYAGSNANAAAYGGDFTKGLIDALNGTYVGTQAVSDADKMMWDTIIAIGQAIPIAGLGFTAVQIYKDGADYVVALNDQKNAQGLALGGMGYQGVIETGERVGDAGQKVFVDVALLPAQIPQLMQALKTGKNLKVYLKGKPPPPSGVSAASDANPATAAPREGTWAPGTQPASDAAAHQQLMGFLDNEAAAGVAQDLQIEIDLAKQAGMSDADIANITKKFNPGVKPYYNQVVAQELMKARLTALGYDVGMVGDEFNKVQNLSLKSYKKPPTPAEIARLQAAGADPDALAALQQKPLTPEDVAWLQRKLDANPWYIDDLTGRGFIADSNRYFGPRIGDGFIPALQDADDVNTLKGAFIESGGRRPAAWNDAGTVRIRPGTSAPGSVVPGATAPAPGSSAPPAGAAATPNPTLALPLKPDTPALQLPMQVVVPIVTGPASARALDRPSPAATGSGTPRLARAAVSTGLNALQRAAGGGGRQRPAQTRFTATGASSGDAFQLHIVNNTNTPLRVVDEAVVLEPVTGGARSTGQMQGPNVATTTIEGFCIERLRQPPPQGVEYSVAPPDVQARYKPLQDVLRAADKVQSLGLLRPDSTPRDYFNSIRQWAIWTSQEKFDERQFTDAFVAQTKKNVEAMKNKWTPEMEKAIRSVSPNRWRDIQHVLEEANKGKVARIATRDAGAIAVTADRPPALPRRRVGIYITVAGPA